MGVADMTQNLLGNYTVWGRNCVSVRVTTWNTTNGIDSSIKRAHGPPSYSETQRDTDNTLCLFLGYLIKVDQVQKPNLSSYIV